MAPFGGSRDYIPSEHKNSKEDQSRFQATAVDLALFLFMIAIFVAIWIFGT